MKQHFLAIIISFVTLMTSGAAIAAKFDPIEANATLDKLSIKLSTEQLVVSHLEDAVGILIDLQKEARDCVESATSELTEIEGKLKKIGRDAKTEEQKYLISKETVLKDRASQCRLFNLRSEEAIKAFTNTINAKVATQLFKSSPPVWENVANLPKILVMLGKDFDATVFVSKSGIKAYNTTKVILTLVVLFVGFLLGALIGRAIKPLLDRDPAEETITQLKLSFYSVIAKYAKYLLPILLLTGTTLLIDYFAGTSSYILYFMYGLSVFVLGLMAVRFLISPPDPQFSFNKLAENVTKKLVWRFKILGFVSLVSFTIFEIISDQKLPEAFDNLLLTVFVILVAINLISVIWLINQLPKMKYKFRGLRIFISGVLGLTLICIISAEIIGFHSLAIRVLYGIVLTVILFMASWFVHKFVIAAIDSLSDESSPWQQKLHYYLGLRPNETLPELIWIRISSYIIVWGLFCGFLLYVWGLSEGDVRLLFDSFYNGFEVANFTIVPSRVLSSLLFFTLFVLITRFLRGYFLRNSNVIKDTSVRFALSTIVGYIGFIFSTIMALLIAGIDFTGIAIIAGALSVGIGLGLQDITNNFVSGLILLLERPIKIGDRVIVGSTEGYVRKISVRSTRIRTQDRTDVIVPNSELVASQVTNLTLKDKFLRIRIPVGVAYGSDVELVRETLLKIATDHPGITNESPHVPRVLFREFGSSSLNFELWAVLIDANQLNEIPSELHFEIDKAFREHGIVIAFPQTDIHIKELPKFEMP